MPQRHAVTGCNLHCAVDKWQHYINTLIHARCIELRENVGVAPASAYNHLAYSGNGDIGIEFEAVDTRVETHSGSGRYEVMGHADALGTAEHQYVERSGHSCYRL